MENDNKTLAQKLRDIAKAKEERDLTPEEIEIVREAVKQIMPTMKALFAAIGEAFTNIADAIKDDENKGEQ